MNRKYLPSGRAVLAGIAALLPLAGAAAADAPIPIRVVVVTTFDTAGDLNGPGEFNTWVVNFPLTEVLPFPQGYHNLRYNADKHVLGIETGEGPVHMAASITALANDKRFDVTKAYWILAGIAGIDPNAGPAGSTAWADYIVDGDLAYEIDARELPPGFSTGYIPLGRSAPYQKPRPPTASINGVNLFHLNAPFVNWAYEFSHSHVTLPDTTNLKQLRALWASSAYPATQSPPLILKGDTLAAGTFWIGARLNTWAEDWVKYWSDGHAKFTMTSEEDAGFAQAMTFLYQAHQVDFGRALDLRAASDYDLPYPGQTVAQLLAQDANGTGYSAFIESLSNVYLTGSSVVNEIATHWDKYRDKIPTAP